MNRLIIIGNLTRDPELRYTPQKVPVCDFTVAVNDRRGQDGEQSTQYIRVTVWRALAEVCAKWLNKGSRIFVSGPLTARTYQAQDGSTRVSLEVTADDVEFLSSRPGSGQDMAPVDRPGASAQAGCRQASMFATGYTRVETDELPF